MLPKTDLTTVSFPPNESLLAFQLDNFDLNLSTRDLQFFCKLHVCSNWKPNIVERKRSMLTTKDISNTSNLNIILFYPKDFAFVKFNFEIGYDMKSP